MATSKKRKRKQKVSFVRSEPPRAAGNSNVIAFPSQSPADGADTPQGQPTAPQGAQARASLTPEPLPEAVHRTSIIEAEVADIVGDEVAGDAPPPAAKAPAPAAKAPGAVGLAEGSIDDEDTVVGVDIPKAPSAPTGIAANTLEYEDDVTAVDALPLGSRGLPGRPVSAAPTDAYPESEVTPVEAVPAAAVEEDDEPADDAPAASEADVEEHPEEETFFSTPPPAPAEDRFDDIVPDGDDDLPVSNPNAMRWTLGIAAAAVLLIGGYWTYQNLILPEPVAMGEAEPAQLPDPSLLEDAPAEEQGVEEAGDVAAATTDEATGNEGEAPAEAADETGIATALGDALADAELSVTPEELATIVALPPEEGPAPGTYEELVTEGELLAGQSKFDEAEKLFRSALALDPQGGEALAHLGFIMLNRGENEHARNLAEYAVLLDPQDSVGWITLGAARQALSDYPGAREAYRSCVSEGQGPYVDECKRMMR